MNPIRQFELIIKIAYYGSISRAAEELRLAQPTLSKYVANIESQLGLELFDRTTLPIRLTEAGEKYIAAGQRIVDTHRQLEKELGELKTNHKSAIVVGCSPTRASYILPQIMAEFRKLNQEAKVVIHERTTRQLNEELLRGELDLIISLLTDTTRQFERVDLFQEDVCLAVPTAMACSEPMQILKSCPIISTGANLRLGRLLSEILYDIKAPEPNIEVQSIESSLSLVDAGQGAMIVPSYIAKYCTKRNMVFMNLPEELRIVLKPELERHVCVFYRKEQFITLSHRDFIKACENTMSV